MPSTQKNEPTEEAPETGAIALFDITLSEGERWVQDGDYVFRSTEFDVTAAGSSFEEGLHRFGTSLINFMLYLSSLEDPAENEVEMLRLLQPRVAKIAACGKTLADELQETKPATPPRKATATRPRSRGDHASEWRTTSKRRNSRKPSLA